MGYGKKEERKGNEEGNLKKKKEKLRCERQRAGPDGDWTRAELEEMDETRRAIIIHFFQSSGQ